MQNPTPTRQELSSYFFDRCTPEISNKVERWFFKNGNSQEAKKLLFSLWEELEDNGIIFSSIFNSANLLPAFRLSSYQSFPARHKFSG